MSEVYSVDQNHPMDEFDNQTEGNKIYTRSWRQWRAWIRLWAKFRKEEYW